jgi:hypothetical protein
MINSKFQLTFSKIKDKKLFIFKNRKKVVAQVFENENKNSDHTIAQTIRDLTKQITQIIPSIILIN